jgi:uncharacterized protein with GYD domain
MPKYLANVSYSTEGMKGVLKAGGTARVEVVRQAVEGLGGTVHSFDYAFGADDVIVIMEFPDNVAAAALALAVSAAGAATTRITVLLSPEEIDQAAKKTVAYVPPGS